MRLNVLLAVLTALLLCILATAELSSIALGHYLADPVRDWLLWASIVSGVATATRLCIHHINRMHAQMTELAERIEHVDQRLAAIDDLTTDLADTVRTELDGAIAQADITRAVQLAVGPTLTAIRDYTAAKPVQGRPLAAVTPLHRSE